MARTPWEEVFWTPEPIFRGETVFCLASGPSMTADIARKVRGRRVLAVNSTWQRLAPWADVWFFTDNNVFEAFRGEIEHYDGRVVTMSRAAKREMPGKVQRVRGQWSDRFPPIGSEFVRQGRSSGHTAISVLVAMGAAKIALLGYDMRVVDGREHHHDDYRDRPRDLDIYQREFVPAFAGWNDAAWLAGVDIVNCTAGSAVTEFPFADLDEVLACSAR